MNGLEVPLHSLRLETEPWHAFGEKVRREPQPAWRSRAAVIRAFIDFYMNSPVSMETLLRDLGDLNDIRATLNGYGKDNNHVEEE
jgi:hypothetical protein